jgi:sugar lactone lactonase YvrE
MTNGSRTQTITVAALFLFVCRGVSQSQLQVGYGVLTAAAGTSVPTATALFTYANGEGIVLWQAGVAAVEPLRSGRIFVDRTPGTRSAIALANPSSQAVTARLTLRDASGITIGAPTSRTLQAHEHVPIFVDQLIQTIPDALTVGSLSFETTSSDQRLAAITLRETTNSLGEPLYATLPVVDLDGAISTQPVIFPHVAIGGGYTTQIILLSRSSGAVHGKIRFVKSDGTAFQLSAGSELPYSIESNGAYRLQLSGGSDVQTGYAVVTLDSGDIIPSGTLIFQYRQNEGMPNERLVTETGVGAMAATTKARIYIERAGSDTGIAIANPGNPATSVVLELMDRQGTSLGTTSVDLPADGHTAQLAWQLFPDLPQGFTGICEIRSQVPVVPVTLLLTTNKRNDFILTTLPVADLTRTPVPGPVIFPQIAFGSGYSTRLILIGTTPSQSSSGTLRLYQSSGAPLSVSLAGQTGDQFAYQVGAGAIRQLRPGNSATAQSIILDPANAGSAEIAVNEGSSVNLVPVVIDSDQSARDDFGFSYSGVNSDVAAIDAQGVIQGRKAGFSTLVVSAGGVVKTATICVVRVNSGITGGYEITGVAQDLARRVYLANKKDQTILQLQSLSAAPERYAGVSLNSGLRDDLRLQSLFRDPAFLAVDQARGNIYVSDSGNHVIRQISSGPAGRVDTLTTDVSLSSPQGTALDSQGNLWIADSGTHAILRLNLATKKVSVIAGQPGSSGFADGPGAQARFNSPAGIAIEAETLAQQLEREKTGAAPPPVSVIVADTGNNQIRRVLDTGKVVTIGTLASSPSGPRFAPNQISAGLFNAPSGVATDSVGNIYVTEPGGGKLKMILAATGQVVPVAQSGTFRSPRGIAITQSGRLLVGSDNRAAQELAYGQPVISSISPDQIQSQGSSRITVTGKNFSPETVVIVAGTKIDGLEVRNTETLVFVTPVLRSGRTIVSVQNRGGLAQTSLAVQPPSLTNLASGSITTVAGGTTFAGEGAAATTGSIALPFAISLDASGNLYIADTFNHRVRRIDALTGILTSVAGTGVLGWEGDKGLATAADLAGPQSVAVDSYGNLIIADTLTNRIRRVDAKTGIITTIAGQYPEFGFGGDNGPATSALLQTPKGVWADSSGNVFIADTYNNRIRKVDPNSGIITTVAGNGQRTYSGDDGPATSAALNRPEQVAVDPAGNVYIGDTGNNRIRKIDATTKIITTYAGNGQESFGGDGGPARLAGLKSPSQVTFDTAGNLYLADSGNARIRRVDNSGVISTAAGNGKADYGGDGGPATSAALADPSGVAVDGFGQIFIADTANFRIRRVDSSGIIQTVGGNGRTSFVGDAGPAWAASLLMPYSLATDASGNLYIADQDNLRIRKVDANTGIITTVSGSDVLGYQGDNGPATQAGFSFPRGVAVDSSGNVFVADTLNNRIRRVDAATKIVTTYAGNGADQGSVDNVPATQSAVVDPYGVGFDTSGNLLIAETGSNKVRKVDRQTGIITTIAGTGTGGYGGDFGKAVSAQLNQPVAVTSDIFGTIFIADYGNNRVRLVTSDGTIYTVAGDGQATFAGEGLPSIYASIVGPMGLAIDSNGNLYIAGLFNRVVRVLNDPTLLLTSVAGTYDFGFGGDGGPAKSATFLVTAGIAFDPSGNLYVTDHLNGRIRVIKGPVGK